MKMAIFEGAQDEVLGKRPQKTNRPGGTVRTAAMRTSRTHRLRSATRQPKNLPERVGQLKIDPCLLIGLRRRHQVEFLCRNGAVVLVVDVERGAREQVIVDLLGGPAVLEDQRHRLFAGRRGFRSERGGKRFRLPGWKLCLLLILPLILLLRLCVAIRCVGRALVRRNARIIVARVVRIANDVRAHPSISRSGVGRSTPISGPVGRAITPRAGVWAAQWSSTCKAAPVVTSESRSAGSSIAAIASGSGGSRCGEAAARARGEASMRARSSVAGGA